MKFEKNKIALFFLALFSFLAFSGSYTTKLIVDDYISLPGGIFRLLIILSLVGAFFFAKKRHLGTPEQCFLLFSFFYIVRLYIEIINGAHYYMPPVMVLFHFLANAFIPVILILHIKLKDEHFNLIAKTIIVGGMLFGGAIYLNFGKYIGEVARLTTEKAGVEDMLSPLTLSYISAMSIGVGISYLYYGDKMTFKKNMAALLVIGFCSIPFFLGASRGSVISLFFPFVVILFSKKGIGNKFKLFVIIGVLLYSGFVLSEYLGQGIINRYISLWENLQSGGYGNQRIVIWIQSLTQFSAHPIWGDGLSVIGYDKYPHNLFIETLLTTGVLGFISLIVLIITAFIKSMIIFRQTPKYTWVGVLFLQCFAQSMLSFSIYSNPWIWIALALLLSVNVKPAIKGIK